MLISVSANARLVFLSASCLLSVVSAHRLSWAACGTVFQTTRPVRRVGFKTVSPVEDRSVVRNCFWSNLAAVLAFAGQPERRSSAWYADTTPDTSDPADAGSGRSHAAPAARACPPRASVWRGGRPRAILAIGAPCAHPTCSPAGLPGSSAPRSLQSPKGSSRYRRFSARSTRRAGSSALSPRRRRTQALDSLAGRRRSSFCRLGNRRCPRSCSRCQTS